MRRALTALLCFALLAAFSNTTLCGEPPGPPRAEVRPVTDTYWGTTVVDDYQYLEKVADPEVGRWVTGQNDYTRWWLDRLPARAKILERVQTLTHSTSPEYYGLSYRSGSYFAFKEQPPKEQPLLVTLPTLGDTRAERVIVDPNAIDSSGATTIDFYVPSLDGRYVAVSLSTGGTEDGTVSVYERATGRKLEDEVPRVNGGTAGGSVAWNADASGFYYTRYPHAGDRPAEDLPFYQQIYFHKLGSPVSADTYALGKEFPRIAEIELETSPDGRWILAVVSNGDGGEYEYWLLGPKTPWKRFARFEDQIVEARFGIDDAVYLLSRLGAPRKRILRLPLANPVLAKATVAVPETEAAIEAFTPTTGRLYVIEMIGGPTQMRVYDLNGRPLDLVTRGEIASFSTPVRTRGDEIAIRIQSYTLPAAYYRYAPGAKELEPTALAHESPADFSDCEVRREFALAEDGTRLPINILIRKGTPADGTAPTLLYAYGSYGYSQKPTFDPRRKLWLEQGGIYAVASIRGGGEYGDAWHRAANLERKKVSIDDFAACARYLVKRGYASAERLAIEGGSAGGLLVNGTMALYPHLMRAVVSYVGIADALRTELSPNGEYNITEFGTVKDERQFRGMHAYSPYHQAAKDGAFPSYLALTGLNDPRVEPWQSFKMVARIQATKTRNPALLRVSTDTGHLGTGLSERDREIADTFTFLFDQLGVSYRALDPSSSRKELPGP